MYHIYALIDPRTLRVRYVGRTKNVARRMYGHQSDASRGKGGNAQLAEWLRCLASARKNPIVCILESREGKESILAEMEWIAKLSDGNDLLNAVKMRAGAYAAVALTEVEMKRARMAVSIEMPVVEMMRTLVLRGIEASTRRVNKSP
jgi:hypothetical protein